jgi:hypothetical protein
MGFRLSRALRLAARVFWIKRNFAPILAAIGALPHAALDFGASSAPPKQKARLLEAECDDCGYTVRVTRKWVDEAGAPHCPKHGAMQVDGIEAEDRCTRCGRGRKSVRHSCAPRRCLVGDRSRHPNSRRRLDAALLRDDDSASRVGRMKPPKEQSVCPSADLSMRDLVNRIAVRGFVILDLVTANDGGPYHVWLMR